MQGLRRQLSRERAADLLLWLAITAPVFLLGEPPEPWQPAGLPLRWVQVVAVPLLGLAVLAARRAPLAAAAVPAALGLAVTPELVTGGLMVAQVLLAYLLGRRLEDRRAALAFFAASCAVGLLLLLVVPNATVSDGFTVVANVLLALVLPWLVGQSVRQRAGLERAGWQLAERLEREQELIGERARLHERARIAGDMHDSLGHDLSLIALRAAAFQVDEGLGSARRQAAGELRQAAEAATERLREVIGVLRQDGEGPPLLPAGDSVASLVERAAASGVAVTLQDTAARQGPGGAGPLPPMAERALCRVVQEALTNAVRHAPGAPVTVSLRRQGGEAVVQVVNEAPPGDPVPPGGPAGHGLIGLDERVRLVGGTLTARPVDGGFAVTARLPLGAGATPTPPGGAVEASRRELAVARRKAWRSMLGAIWLPAAATAVLVGLVVAYDLNAPNRPVLNVDVYGYLRIGEPLSQVEPRLPARSGGEPRPARAPADPPGVDECRFYRPAWYSPPVYRLCFTDGRLSHKDTLDLD